MVNKISPKKLLGSKWTAASPVRKEKQFTVTEVSFDEAGNVIRCLIEAVISNRVIAIDWKELKNRSNWIQGWK